MVDIEYIKSPPEGGNRFYGSDYGREQMVLAANKIIDLQAKLDKAVEALMDVCGMSSPSWYISRGRRSEILDDINKIARDTMNEMKPPAAKPERDE